jgi:hypothetical protein
MSENRRIRVYDGTGAQDPIVEQGDRDLCISVELEIGDDVDVEVTTSKDPNAAYLPLLSNITSNIAAYDMPHIYGFRLNINTNASGAIKLGMNSTRRV